MSGFDAATSPTAGMGVVAETFRTRPGPARPGTRRSGHPAASICLNGPDADRCLGPHDLAWAAGENMPLGRLRHLEAMMLLLIGVGWNRCSALHTAETLAWHRRAKTRRFKDRAPMGHGSRRSMSPTTWTACSRRSARRSNSPATLPSGRSAARRAGCAAFATSWASRPAASTPPTSRAGIAASPANQPGGGSVPPIGHSSVACAARDPSEERPIQAAGRLGHADRGCAGGGGLHASPPRLTQGASAYSAFRSCTLGVAPQRER